MRPNLMRSPGARLNFQPRDAVTGAEDAPITDGRLPGRIDQHPPARFAAALDQWGLDPAGRLGRAPAHDGPVGFLDPPRRERRLRVQKRRPPQGNDEAAGRIGVQPVREPGTVLPPRQFRETILDAGAAARAGMHGQAGGLVENHEAGVLKQDRYRGGGHQAPPFALERGDRIYHPKQAMSEPGIEIQPFDPHTASAAAWRRLHTFRRIRAEEDEPGEPIYSDADFEHDLLRHWPLRETRRAIALDGEAIVGAVGFAFRRPGTPDYEVYAPFLWGWGGVLQSHRRRRIASALLRPLLAFMREQDKTIATFGTHLPEGRAFLEAIGAAEKMRSIENRMHFAGLDWAELAAWEAAAASGLRWELHIGRAPLERLAMLLPQISELFRDVPMGTLERPPMTYEIQGYTTYYENLDRNGGEHFLVLLMDAGRIAAICEAGWDSRFPDRVYQTLTAVARQWRGKGLGKAVKAAMLRILRARHPEIRMITTANEVANAAMLSINDRLGFAQYRLDVTYQIKRDGLETWINGRASYDRDG